MNEGAKQANQQMYKRGIDNRLDKIIGLLEMLIKLMSTKSEK